MSPRTTFMRVYGTNVFLLVPNETVYFCKVAHVVHSYSASLTLQTDVSGVPIADDLSNP